MNSIALTGPTSMIGLSLINECIKNNTLVYAILRPNSLKKELLPKSPFIKIIICDLNNLDAYIPDNISLDVFFHIGWSFTDKQGRNSAVMQEKNIAYTLAAVSLASRMSCKRFIGIGSQAEYGRVNHIISPDTPVNPDSAYGIAKYAAGKLSKIECDRLKIEHVWVRVFSVYGKNDNDRALIKTFIQKLINNESMPLTKCEQIWDYLFEDDAGNALYLLGKKGKNGKIYCLGSGEGKPLKEYLLQIRNIVNPTAPLNFGEIPLADNQIMYLCADTSDLITDTGWNIKNTFGENIKKIILREDV